MKRCTRTRFATYRDAICNPVFLINTTQFIRAAQEGWWDSRTDRGGGSRGSVHQLHHPLNSRTDHGQAGALVEFLHATTVAFRAVFSQTVHRAVRFEVRRTKNNARGDKRGVWNERSFLFTIANANEMALTCSHFQRNRWQAPRSRTNIRRSSRRLPGSKSRRNRHPLSNRTARGSPEDWPRPPRVSTCRRRLRPCIDRRSSPSPSKPWRRRGGRGWILLS